MNTPTIVYVSTEVGDDLRGDGSKPNPYRTTARALSDHPDAFVCVNDVLSNRPPRPLTELGEPTADFIDEPQMPVGVGLIVALVAALILWGLIALTVMNGATGALAATAVVLLACCLFGGEDR